MLRTSFVSMATLSLLSAGCAIAPPQPGVSRAEVLKAWGQPTARYALVEGGERLEFATGPYGRTTWMIDLDPQAVVKQSRQVLSESEFFQVQSALELRREGLLQWLGTPGERRSGGRAGGEVWSWRYPTNDCLWFQASVADGGRVTSSAYAIDPSCDKGNEARSP